jgi:hypothetical protein
MAKVYGTNLPDNLTGLFDGITDGDDIIFGFGGSDQMTRSSPRAATTSCRAATDTTTSTAAMASTPRTMATPRKE